MSLSVIEKNDGLFYIKKDIWFQNYKNFKCSTRIHLYSTHMQVGIKISKNDYPNTSIIL